jgi:hypothetical protein
MTTTKQRLDGKIERTADNVNDYDGSLAFENGANLLAPLLLEMVECLKYYQGYEAISSVADDVLNKFEGFCKRD